MRVYLGRDPQTGTRKHHNQTIHGSFREAQRFLNLKLQLHGNGRVSCAAVLSLNQFSRRAGRKPDAELAILMMCRSANTGNRPAASNALGSESG